MTTFIGFVKKINEKTGTNKRGKWTLYSAKLEDDQGREYDEWISIGFERPKFKEGDYVKIETEQDDNGREKLVDVQVKKNPPSRGGAKQQEQAKPSSSKATNASSGEARASGPSADLKNAIIGWQASRNAAVEVISLLLAHKALPITGAQTKAGEAKRFVEITAAIDKQTVEFFNDAAAGGERVLKRVADAGLEKGKQKPQSELPDDSDEKAEPDPDPANGDDADGSEGWDNE